MTTHKDVSAYLTRLYPQIDPQVAVLDIRAMRDIPADQILDAITTHRQTAAHGFPPTPGELRALIELRHPSPAELAWMRYQSLPRIPRDSDVSWFDGSGKAQAIMQQWIDFRSDPASLAGLLASCTAQEEHGALRGSKKSRRAFLDAFRSTALRLSYGPTQKHLPSETSHTRE